MEDDAPAVGVAGKVDVSSALSSSSSTSRSRPTWGRVMRQTWARTSSRRLNSKSSTAPAAAAGGPGGGGLSKSAPEKDDEKQDKKRSKAKRERTKTTKKTRIRIDKAAEERRALTSDFSCSSSSSCASPSPSPSPSYISSSSSSSRYGTFAQSASATLTTAGSARGPRGRFGYESLRAGRIAPLTASGPWDETVSWVIDERRPSKVSGEIVRQEEPSGKQRTAAGDVTGKDGDGVARRDRAAGGEKAKAESVEEEESEDPDAVGEDAAEKGAFDLLRAYYPHSLTSLATKKGKEKSDDEREREREREGDDESESESESNRDKIVKAKSTGEEEPKNVTIASERDNEREGGKEKKEAINGKRPRRKRRAVSAKRNDEGRLLRLRAKLYKSGDILLCMRRERSYDVDDKDKDGSGDGAGGVSTPEYSPELQGRDGRGRRADAEGQIDAAAAPEAKTKKPSTPKKEEKESEAERAMEEEMEELWKRASKQRRCSEPFAFPSRRSRGKARRADADEAVGGDGGRGSRDRSNTITSFVLAFEERKDLSQLARERDQEKSERKSRWRAYSFITPRRNRNGSNAQPAAPSPSPSSSSNSQPQDSPAAAGVVQVRPRSSSLGAPRPNINLIEQPLRQARSLSDDEGESSRPDDDDDIYGGGAANTFVDIDNRPRPHQQLLLHQQAQRDRRRRQREAAERKEEDERPHETTRDNGNKNEGSAKPSWRNLKLLFSSER